MKYAWQLLSLVTRRVTTRRNTIVTDVNGNRITAVRCPGVPLSGYSRVPTLCFSAVPECRGGGFVRAVAESETRYGPGRTSRLWYPFPRGSRRATGRRFSRTPRASLASARVLPVRLAAP